MKRSEKVKYCGLAVSGVLFSILFFQGLGWAAEPGVTDTEIKIGVFFPFTGPATFLGQGHVEGTTLRYEEVNAAGGIHGRKLKMLLEDDACSATKAMAAVKKLLSENVFAIYGGSCSNSTYPTIPVIAEAKVPLFVPGAITTKITVPFNHYVFRTGPPRLDIGGACYADMAVQGFRYTKIAVLNQADEFGKNGRDFVIKRLKEKYNIEPLINVEYNLGDTDLSSQVLKIKALNPECVITMAYVKEGAIFVRQAKELGLNAQIVGDVSMNDVFFPDTVKDASIGVVLGYPFVNLVEGAAPGMVKFREAYKKRYPTAQIGKPYFTEPMSYAGFDVFCEGLRRAGRNLTREKFIKALESLKNYETGFLQPVTFTPTDHDGIKAQSFTAFFNSGRRLLIPASAYTEFGK